MTKIKGKDASPAQEAVLLYGQSMRGLGSVTELKKQLRRLGFNRSADCVERATKVLHIAAKNEYEKKRKEIDPNWKSPYDKLLEEILLEDAEERERKLQEK